MPIPTPFHDRTAALCTSCGRPVCAFMADEQNWSEVVTQHVPASFLLGTKESLLRGRTVKRDRLGKTIESVAVSM